MRYASSPSRRLFRVTGGLAAVLVAALLAGCGGDAETPEVATAGGAAAQPTSSVSSLVAQFVEERRKLAKCLREQGFDVPDPDSKGNLDLSASMGGQRKQDPKVRAAWEACKQFNQMPVPAELQEPEEKLTPEQIARAREHSKCMRDNGMPDWPDPLPDGTLPEGWGRELTPQEQAANLRAIQICEPVRDGRPPTTPDPNQTVQG